MCDEVRSGDNSAGVGGGLEDSDALLGSVIGGGSENYTSNVPDRRDESISSFCFESCDALELEGATAATRGLETRMSSSKNLVLTSDEKDNEALAADPEAAVAVECKPLVRSLASNNSKNKNKKSSKSERDKKSKSSKKKRAPRIGDGNLRLDLDSSDTYDYYLQVHDKAPWSEIHKACFSHITMGRVGIVCLKVLGLLLTIYGFMFGVELMAESAQILVGCQMMGAFFSGSSINPVSMLMIGILATVFMQSSGTVTGIVVKLTSYGTVSVREGIFVVMGANIGTCVTCAAVALIEWGRPDNFARAFEGAVIHNLFNFLTVAVLFPLELATGYLEALSGVLASGAELKRSTAKSYQGPIKQYIRPLISRLILCNKSLIQDVSSGHATCPADYYPIECDPDVSPPTYKSCRRFGLITCDKTTGDCPIFFSPHASPSQDQRAGWLCLVLSFIILFSSMYGIIRFTQSLLYGLPTKVVYTVTHCNGYFAILVGFGVTMLVQASGVTTSMIVPLASIGALRLEQQFPLIVGANLGTATNVVITALSSKDRQPLQVALSHLFFNVTGFMLWYPLPPLRFVPLYMARRTRKIVLAWSGYPLFHILLMFVLGPLFFFLLSELYTSKSSGSMAAAVILTVVPTASLIYFIYWFNYKDGDKKFLQFVQRVSLKSLGFVWQRKKKSRVGEDRQKERDKTVNNSSTTTEEPDSSPLP